MTVPISVYCNCLTVEMLKIADDGVMRMNGTDNSHGPPASRIPRTETVRVHCGKLWCIVGRGRYKSLNAQVCDLKHSVLVA